jgi:hypothetical protein
MATQPRTATLPPGLLDRLRTALAAVRSGRSAADERPGAGPPTDQLATDPTPPADAPRAVIFVTVFGLSPAALEEVLEVVMREGEGTPVSPVFLTDSLDFKPFRARRLRFEYLPDGGRRHRFAPDLDWRTYERRRYRLLAAKWRPQSLISFGTPAPPDGAAAIRSLTSGA